MLARRVLTVFALHIIQGGFCALTFAAEPSPEALLQFEQHVRPLLAEKCWKCHGAEKQEANLRLDSTASATAGGDSGPALIPGEPDRSPMIAAVRYADDVKMPPDGQLSARDRLAGDLDQRGRGVARACRCATFAGRRAGGRAAVGPADCRGRARCAVGAAASDRSAAARVACRQRDQVADRPIYSSPAGRAGDVRCAAGRQAHAHSPGVFRSAGSAATGRRGRSLCE